jgi:hypothetical protein
MMMPKTNQTLQTLLTEIARVQNFPGGHVSKLPDTFEKKFNEVFKTEEEDNGRQKQHSRNRD